LEGKNKKLIILDLDNTLWGGILGDLGWKKINVGGHNIHGEAFKDFQIKLLSLKNLGVQLALCSKNDEETVLNAIEKNPNMVLKKKDFASWRINWDDKAKNVKEIISELNLTNDSTVFIDDNIAERERVKVGIRGIFVPDWPEDPCRYVEKIQNLGCFNLQHITYEDKNRTKFYKDEKTRKKTKEKFISYDKWLASLKTRVHFEKGNDKNKKRILQLINKTNQMNLSTRRISELELNKLIKNKNYRLLSCKVSDKFGEMGLVGVVSFKLFSNKIVVIDFILSCRAFGRSIEKSMLLKIIQVFKKKKINKIIFKYLKTKKNKPCLNFLKTNLEKEKNNTFIYKRNTKFISPKFLKII
jgi:FkbH-like protein